MDSRAISRGDIGFYIGTLLWPLLKSINKIQVFSAIQ